MSAYLVSLSSSCFNTWPSFLKNKFSTLLDEAVVLRKMAVSTLENHVSVQLSEAVCILLNSGNIQNLIIVVLARCSTFVIGNIITTGRQEFRLTSSVYV